MVSGDMDHCYAFIPSRRLQSGWLVGEQNIAGTAGLVAAHMGTGKRPHRLPRNIALNPYGTFKLLFNTSID
jgi:hypothetical protein